jgi:hypothetical protein
VHDNRREVFSVVRTTHVVAQRCGKHISAAVNRHATIEEAVFSVMGAARLYNEDLTYLKLETSYGGGFEYFHRSPASRKRRRKGNPVPGGITGPPCSWGGI